MNTDELLSRQAERQNAVIDALLKENDCLKAIITTYLLQDGNMSEAEKHLVMMLTGNYGVHSFPAMNPGENIGGQSFSPLSPGRNIGDKSYPGTSPGENSGSYTAPSGDTPGISENRMAYLVTNLAKLMKTARTTTLRNTIVLLFQWQANQRMAPAALCKLTGQSKGELAKRIMAIKRAGLIVRHNAPMRFELTDKAKELLAGPPAQ